MAGATKAQAAAPAVLVEYRVVSRSFDGNGCERYAGEVVNINADGWRNAGLLEQMRYLRDYKGGTPVAAKDGRLFIDEATRDRYEAHRKQARKRSQPAGVQE